MTSLSHPLDILSYIAAFRGEVALAVVTGISGGTLRAKGALMAVSKDEAAGYISAGCVDGDIILQARQALETGENRALIYGEGSPFKDIALPCGGTIHVNIIPNPDKDEVRRVAGQLAARKPARLHLAGIEQNYQPHLRLRIIGRGAPFTGLANLALTSGFAVHGQSPDPALENERFEQFDHLTDPDRLMAIEDDPWTAVIFLFHDHDWEPALLQQALSGNAFYIGAMGSDKTHAARLQTLESKGVQSTSQIKGPIGLLPAMRDAQLLAISILAEIIDEAQKQALL